MWISICLLRGAEVVGTDTYEILGAQRTEEGIKLLVPMGSIELQGHISQALSDCAEALTPDESPANSSTLDL